MINSKSLAWEEAMFKKKKQAIMSCLFIATILMAFGDARKINSFRPTRLLPVDGSIVHIAGEVNMDFSELDEFNNYSNYLQDGTKPMGAMYYVSLTLPPQNITIWFQGITAILNNNTMYKQDQWLSVQLGSIFVYVLNFVRKLFHIKNVPHSICFLLCS